MTRTPRDIRSQRLYLKVLLASGAQAPLERPQANYLVNVLRLRPGAHVRVFNGRDGEWQATLVEAGRKAWRLDITAQTRPQPPPSDLHYLFVPLRQARLDYMVEKAVEMGVGRLRPVLAQHGQVARLNPDRVAAHAIEAAEQCGLLSVPTIDPPRPLVAIIDGWDAEEASRRIVFCDEQLAADPDPLSILSGLEPSPLAVLIGPEGGFSDGERRLLRSRPFVTALPLGPRILRADTAAVAALALVQAMLGDWRTGIKSAPDEGSTTVNEPS
jgi:16S rRNA (uracil1498-N3)-methyltransferase